MYLEKLDSAELSVQYQVSAGCPRTEMMGDDLLSTVTVSTLKESKKMKPVELAQALCNSKSAIVQALSNRFRDHHKKKGDPIATGRTYLENEARFSDWDSDKEVYWVLPIVGIIMTTLCIKWLTVSPTGAGEGGAVLGGVLFIILTVWGVRISLEKSRIYREYKNWREVNSEAIDDFWMFVRAVEYLLKETGWSVTTLLEFGFDKARAHLDDDLYQLGRIVTCLEKDTTLGIQAQEYQSEMVRMLSAAKPLALNSKKGLEDYFPKKEVPAK